MRSGFKGHAAWSPWRLYHIAGFKAGAAMPIYKYKIHLDNCYMSKVNIKMY